MVAILVIVTATIVMAIVTHVIVIGDMKMITKLIDFVKANPFKTMFIGWILAFVVPLLFKPGVINKKEKDTLNYYEVSFLSASALFTGIAFAVTYSSLTHQKESINTQIDLLEEQIKMDVFSDVSEDLRSEKFLKCRKYLNSKSYYDDIERIKQLTKKEDISLQDFKDICYEDGFGGIDENEKTYMRNSYNMILRFCSRMEYLGFIYYNTSTNIIVDYYGRTILNLYKRLKPLIETKKDDKTEYLYFYFAYLFNYAKQREESYYKERENEISKFSS